MKTSSSRFSRKKFLLSTGFFSYSPGYTAKVFFFRETILRARADKTRNRIRWNVEHYRSETSKRLRNEEGIYYTHMLTYDRRKNGAQKGEEKTAERFSRGKNFSSKIFSHEVYIYVISFVPPSFVLRGKTTRGAQHTIFRPFSFILQRVDLSSSRKKNFLFTGDLRGRALEHVFSYALLFIYYLFYFSHSPESQYRCYYVFFSNFFFSAHIRTRDIRRGAE